MPIIEPPAFKNDKKGDIPFIRLTEISLLRGSNQLFAQLSQLYNVDNITEVKKAVAKAGDTIFDFINLAINSKDAGSTDLTREQVISGLQERNSPYDTSNLNRYLEWLRALYPGTILNTYRIPVLESYGYSHSSKWETGNVLSALKKSIGSMMGPLNSVVNLAPINHELGKNFNSASTSLDSMTIYLINDTDENASENLRFIHALNLASRYSQWYTQVHPPNIFEVEIPGFYYCPYASVKQLSVKSIGQFSKMYINNSLSLKLPYPDASNRENALGSRVEDVLDAEVKVDPKDEAFEDSRQGFKPIGSVNQTEIMLIPQAYKLTLGFDELVNVPQELYAAGVLGSYRITTTSGRRNTTGIKRTGGK